MNKYPKRSQIFFSVDRLENKTYESVLFALNSGYHHFTFSEAETNMSELNRALVDWFSDDNNDREEYFFQGIISIKDIENNQTRNAITRISKELDVLRGVDCLILERPSLNFEWTERAWYELKVHQEWGVIKFAGVANFDKEQILYLWNKINFKPSSNLIEMNIRNQRWDRVAWCQENGIHVQAYGTLQSVNASKKLNEIAMNKKIPVENFILAWILNCDISPCVSSQEEGHIFANYKYRNFELTQEEIIFFWRLNKFKNKYNESFLIEEK
jgi:diketogulonate reductase-like aldo/keto reductase